MGATIWVTLVTLVYNIYISPSIITHFAAKFNGFAAKDAQYTHSVHAHPLPFSAKYDII